MIKFSSSSLIFCAVLAFNILMGCSNTTNPDLIFPSEYSFVNFCKEDEIINNNSKSIKIVVWADSVGCTGCKLQLDTWQYSIKKLNDKFPTQIGYLFFLQFKEEADMKFFLGLDDWEEEEEDDDSTIMDDDFFQIRFPYPVVWDSEGVFGKLNNTKGYVCYIITDKNKILYKGEPPFTPEILKKYETVIGDYYNL